MNKPPDNAFGIAGWPQQAIDILTKMRGERASLKEIANELGITRSMVSGKVRRMKLAPMHRAPAPTSSKAKAPTPVLRVVPVIVLPPCKPVPLLRARSWQCRSVVSERDKKGLAMICARPVTLRMNGQPSAWCAEHYRLYIDLERMERHGKTRAHL